MRRLLVLAASAAVLVAAPASAAVIFSDNFDASVGGLNVTPTGWTVANGTVDVVGGGFCPGGVGQCVDLDGSTSNAGELSRSFNLTGGVTYIASYDLSGNQRGGSDTVDISFGTATDSISLGAGAPFANFSLNFTPTVDGVYTLQFANQGGDNVGVILDNVSISSVTGGVPEPATWAMMITGFTGMGAMLRRRRGLARLTA